MVYIGWLDSKSLSSFFHTVQLFKDQLLDLQRPFHCSLASCLWTSSASSVGRIWISIFTSFAWVSPDMNHVLIISFSHESFFKQPCFLLRIFGLSYWNRWVIPLNICVAILLWIFSNFKLLYLWELFHVIWQISKEINIKGIISENMSKDNT